jgi:hypothetical protein
MKREPQATTKCPGFRAVVTPCSLTIWQMKKEAGIPLDLPMEAGSRKLASFRNQNSQL